MKLIARVFLIVAIMGCGIVVAAEEKSTSPLQAQEKAADKLLDLHIMRKVFDQNYTGPYISLAYPAGIKIKWPEWEKIYFQRAYYRERLEQFISEDWSIGPWWWQAKVKIQIPNELDRGGPIRFVVDYPWTDGMSDLIYEVTKNKSGGTIVSMEGEYHPPRLSYLQATIVMTLTFGVALCVIGTLLLGLGYILWSLYEKAVDWVISELFGGQGNQKWIRHFVGCVLGAAICLVAWTVTLILL